MVSEHQVDIVVIGLGPGGEYLAGRLAKAGLAVAGVEARLVGGECPYWGCVPSKMMIRAANLLAEGRRIPGLAGSSRVTPDWAPVADRIRAEATDNWDDTVAADRFTARGGRLYRGYGRITAAGEVTVGGEVLRARRGIVIATGTAPAIPPIPGLAGTPFWTNHEAIEARRLPESIVVLGGGAVGADLERWRRLEVAAADRLGDKRLGRRLRPRRGHVGGLDDDRRRHLIAGECGLDLVVGPDHGQVLRQRLDPRQRRVHVQHRDAEGDQHRARDRKSVV